MHYYIADTETAGLKPPSLPASGVVQVAWIKVDAQLNILDEKFYLVNPLCPIDPGASNIHGVYAADVQGCSELKDVLKFEYPATIIGHNCLTGDHEVLTQSGWVRLDCIESPIVQAATWDNGKIEFTDSLVVKQDFEGEMLEYSSTYHCGVYTPNHEIVHTLTNKLLNKGSPKWNRLKAKDYAKLGPNTVAIPCAGDYEAAEVLEFTPNQARLIEAIRADGHITLNSIRFNFSKTRKIERLINLLELEGLNYSQATRKDGVSRLSILKHPFRDKVRDLLGVGKAKRIGSWVLKLSLEARRAFLDEAEYWDGRTANNSSSSLAQVLITSQHAGEAEWFQIAAALTNRGSKIKLDKPNIGGFSTPSSKLSTVTLRNRNYVKTLYKPKAITHKGLVYCLTTLTGAFLVRRRNTVWVTGNCSFDLRFLQPHLSEDVKSICTLALARRYIKNSSNHKLVTLVDHLKLPREEAHNALGDVKMTRHLLQYLMLTNDLSLDELASATQDSKVLHHMPFGKYKGTLILSLPDDYIQWLLTKADIAPDLRKSLEHFSKIKKL